MRVYLVVVLGRQHLGDYIFQRADSAWWQKDEAEARLAELRKELTENGKQKLVRITTTYGEADCLCEAGAFEFEMPPPPSTPIVVHHDEPQHLNIMPPSYKGESK